jgi:signal transduction histidine kinase
MQERAKSLAGALSIQTALGQGTKITLTIPNRDAT